MKVSVEGPVHAFGCGITPTGWAALLGVDASGMINRVVDAHDVFGRDVLRRATRALVAGPDMAAMAKIGEALIGTLVDRRDGGARAFVRHVDARSEAHTSELQSLMRISYAVFCWKKKN